MYSIQSIQSRVYRVYRVGYTEYTVEYSIVYISMKYRVETLATHLVLQLVKASGVNRTGVGVVTASFFSSAVPGLGVSP